MAAGISEAQAVALLDFSQPLNVGVLEAVVLYMHMGSAIQVSPTHLLLTCGSSLLGIRMLNVADEERTLCDSPVSEKHLVPTPASVARLY